MLALLCSASKWKTPIAAPSLPLPQWGRQVERWQVAAWLRGPKNQHSPPLLNPGLQLEGKQFSAPARLCFGRITLVWWIESGDEPSPEAGRKAHWRRPILTAQGRQGGEGYLCSQNPESVAPCSGSCWETPVPPTHSPLLIHRPGRWAKTASAPRSSPWPRPKRTILLSETLQRISPGLMFSEAQLPLKGAVYTTQWDQKCKEKTPVSSPPLHQSQAREGGQGCHSSWECITSEKLPRRQRIFWSREGKDHRVHPLPGPLPPRLHIQAAGAEEAECPWFPLSPLSPP